MGQKILFIHPQIFVNMCIEGIDKCRIIKNILPKDAQYVRAFVNDVSGWGKVGLVIESNEFEELKDGDVIPILPDPAFEKVYEK